MNADLKRVRDGGLEETGSPLSKKRILSPTSAQGPSSPSADDDNGGIEDWMKEVESRRKEAIYRQMLEYRRSFEAEQRRAEQLEAQQRVLEASIQAVEVCWTQVVTAMQAIAGQPIIDIAEGSATEPRLEVRCRHGQLEKAIQSRLPVTERIVKGFSEIASKGGLRPAATDELQHQCQQMQVQTNTLRSSEKLLQSQIATLTQSNYELSKDLEKARKSNDRQRMEHDKARAEWTELDKLKARDNGTPGPSKPNGSGHATPNGKTEEDVKPSLPGPSADVQLQDTSELEKLAATRLAELQTLREQHTTLQQQHDRLKVESSSPTDEVIRASPYLQVYLQRLAFQQSRADELQQHVAVNDKKLDDLRQTNGEFREAVLAESRQEIETLRQQSSRKDQDLARLRGQRDDMQAELSERTARETEKLQFVEQVEGLASARQERVNYLSSEVNRLKGKLAAQAGSEGYLSFLRGDGGIDGDYVADLEKKASAAATEISALKTQLESSSSDPASAVTESQVRVELEQVRGLLDRYQRIFGPDAETADDVRQLGEKLEQADKENKRLQLQLEEADASTNALYTEVEGLSKLYEELDAKVKSKCFELKDGELKLQRLITEKAKADNKFFAAMRAKEGIDAQAKMAQRTVEKQSRLLEKAQEVEKTLQSQIATQEQAVTQLKNALSELQRQVTTVSSEKSSLEHQLQHAQKHLSEAQQIMHIRVAESASDREARRKVEEEAEVSAKMVRKLKEKQEAMISAPNQDMSASEWQMREERDKLLKLLKCSCCEQNFKQQVITKCMHTFCKACLDSRIASRQRKCPACGTGFAKEDVQTLYWQ